MTMEQKISMAIAYKGISQAALAREVGTTPSNFNQKLKRGTFTVEELEKIGEALGASISSALNSLMGPRYSKSSRRG